MNSYQGDKLITPYLHPETQKVEIQAYLPDPGLVQAIKLAIHLRRPLLLMGEPGCGKTRVAETVAYELYRGNYARHFFKWYVKSTTQAVDGIYQFDAVKRLMKLQSPDGAKILEQEAKLKGKELEKFFIEEQQFIQKGPLAKAIDFSQKNKTPAVLLIDEIDKADIDFPNDLLLELDKSSYYIKESDTFTEIEEAYKPLIFITSNNEKELPPAFLRRCIFHFIHFPGKDLLVRILKSRFAHSDHKLSGEIVEAFIAIRKKMEQSLSEKKLSTSELIDWFSALEQHPKDPSLKIGGTSMAEVLKKVKEKVAQEPVAIPFYQVLLKTWDAMIALLPPESYLPAESASDA